eukprot:7314979-Prymnesium_polylepis.1
MGALSLFAAPARRNRQRTLPAPDQPQPGSHRPATRAAVAASHAVCARMPQVCRLSDPRPQHQDSAALLRATGLTAEPQTPAAPLARA